MAKRNRAQGTGAATADDALEDDFDGVEGAEAPAGESSEDDERTLVQASVSFPVVIDHEARSPRHLDVQLTTAQGRGLRRLRDGLDHSGARLESGRRVQSYPETIRWLLEQIAAGSDG